MAGCHKMRLNQVTSVSAVVILGFGNIKFWTALLIFTAVAIICTENSPQRRIVKFDEVFSCLYRGSFMFILQTGMGFCEKFIPCGIIC